MTHGGTNRVMEGILTILDKDRYDISLLSLRNFDLSDPYTSSLSRFGKLYSLSQLVPKCFSSYYSNKIYLYHFALKKYLRCSFLLNFLFWASRRYVTKRIEYDLIVAFEEGNCTLFASKIEGPKIAWVHCDYNYYIKSNNPQLKDEYRIYCKFDRIICVSKYTSNSFKGVFGNLASKVDYIYNPLDKEMIVSMSNKALNDPFFKNDAFTILSVGRYAEVKQFHLIPDIIKKIIELSPSLKFKWYIIGDGSKKLIDATNEKIKKYGIEGLLVLLGSKDNPYNYMKFSNLYVCTSYSEAYPCVINEAHALSLPVLSADFPSAGEVITTGSGIITDFDKIPNIIINLINDEDGCYSRLCYSKNEIKNGTIAKQLDNLFSSISR